MIPFHYLDVSQFEDCRIGDEKKWKGYDALIEF